MTKETIKEQPELLGINVVSNCATYSITPQIRYKKTTIDLGNGLAKEEYRLQQRWQGSDGSEDWQWIEYVE
jgi:hypothetical protein